MQFIYCSRCCNPYSSRQLRLQVYSRIAISIPLLRLLLPVSEAIISSFRGMHRMKMGTPLQSLGLKWFLPMGFLNPLMLNSISTNPFMAPFSELPTGLALWQMCGVSHPRICRVPRSRLTRTTCTLSLGLNSQVCYLEGIENMHATPKSW